LQKLYDTPVPIGVCLYEWMQCLLHKITRGIPHGCVAKRRIIILNSIPEFPGRWKIQKIAIHIIQAIAYEIEIEIPIGIIA
jgi:hypothetical protein